MEGYAAPPYDWIYLVEILGERFAVDTRLGRRLELSDEAWRFLAASAEETSWGVSSDIVPARTSVPLSGPLREELEALRLSGGRAMTAIPDDQPPALQTLTLNVVHGCNLKCDYCFEDWPNLRNGYLQAKGLMKPEVAEKAVDLLIRESGQVGRLVLSFFGGEPLLNWPVIRSTTLYAEDMGRKAGKEFHFTLTTNATLLDDEIQQFLIDHDFEVIISIDGTPSTHDTFRIFHNGNRSFEAVMRRAQEFKRRLLEAGQTTRATLTVRGTFFRPTMDFESSTFYLADEGFESISIENGVMRPEHPIALRVEDLEEVKAGYDRFVKRLADDLASGRRRFRFFHMVRVLETIGLKIHRKRECGAGTGYMALDPSGNLYPCHKFVGLSDVRMGSVQDGVTRPEVGLELWHTNVETKETCRQCWARYMCGGGCHADAHLIHGRFNEPDPVSCELLRHRVRLGLYLMRRLEREAPEVLRTLVPGIVDEDYRPTRIGGIRQTEAEDCLIVYNPATRKVHELNPVAAVILHLCDGEHDLAEISREISEGFEIPYSQAEPDVREAVTELISMGLVA